MDKFIQGFMCAVATMLRLEKGADADLREVFLSCAGDCSIADLKDYGVDQNDLSIISAHWEDLHK